MIYTTNTPATTLISDVREALQDKASVRWSNDELVTYINRAQLDIHRVRPDSTATTKSVSLRAGVRQTVPVEAASLIDIPSNTGGGAITKINKVTLDAVERNWRSATPSDVVLHFMHDLRTPRQFEVYPPAAGARVDIEFSAYPVEVTTAPGGYTQISLGPQWVPALYHLVLYYCWSKDAEYAANAALATSHLARAEQMLGVELQTSTTVAPKE